MQTHSQLEENKVLGMKTDTSHVFVFRQRTPSRSVLPLVTKNSKRTPWDTERRMVQLIPAWPSYQVTNLPDTGHQICISKMKRIFPKFCGEGCECDRLPLLIEGTKMIRKSLLERKRMVTALQSSPVAPSDADKYKSTFKSETIVKTIVRRWS